jgi:hypothetical protein
LALSLQVNQREYGYLANSAGNTAKLTQIRVFLLRFGALAGKGSLND